jgi:hypothetical protein
MSDETLLNLDFGVALYSARGLTQSLAPDGASRSMRRTVNGRMVDLSVSGFRKYVSTIQCRDTGSPALSGIWPGQIVVVDCIVELCHETATAGQERTAVAGSEREANGFTYYRPQLTMMVDNFQIDRDEWGAMVGWTLDLVEV